MVTIFSNSSAELELISGLDLDQSGAFRLVFGLSQKAQPQTHPKSEVTQYHDAGAIGSLCITAIPCVELGQRLATEDAIRAVPDFTISLARFMNSNPAGGRAAFGDNSFSRSENKTSNETNGVNNAVSCYKEADCSLFSASSVTSLFASF